MTISLKHIKVINFISILVTFILWIIFFKSLFGDEHLLHNEKFRSWYPGFISSPLLNVFALIISLKTKPHKGILLYALFLTLVSQDFVLGDLRLVNASWTLFYICMISFAVTGTVFIKSLQIFPRALTRQDVDTVFKKGIINKYVKWSVNDYTWFVFPLIILGLGSLSAYSKSVYNATDTFTNVGILVTGLLCLYVNYRKSTASERNKILWFSWGLFTYSFLAIIGLTIRLFNNGNDETIRLVLTSLMAIVLTLSLVMCLFFSDTFDTGVIIRRTIVDGTIFTLIVMIYNTIEHYFLHWLSEVLHLSDVLISSFLSGVFVLVFSPLHHRLMSFLEKKIKKHHADAIVQHTE